MENPYINLTEDERFRLNVDVSLDDILVIKAVSPGKGTTQAFVSQFVKSIADELRARNIRYYSAENLEAFKQLVQRRTAPFTPGETHKRDEPAGAKSVRSTSKSVKNK